MNKISIANIGIALQLASSWTYAQHVEIEASSPQSTALSIYDTGFALVSELRRITPASGENSIRIRGLPSALEPSTVSFIPLAGAPGLDIREQLFRDDASSSGRLLERFQGHAVRAVTDREEVVGRLIAAPSYQEGEWSGPLVVLMEDDRAYVVPDAQELDYVALPDASRHAFLEPTILWRAEALMEGPQNIRLTYQANGLRWHASYEVILDESGSRAYMAGRMGIENQSGGDFHQAQIQVVNTERGMIRERAQPALRRMHEQSDTGPAMRYIYGVDEPVFEQAAVSPSPVHSYRLPEPVTLLDGDTKYMHYAVKHDMPVTRFYVYDGVRFDRFQRNRRNDWNYGTESHDGVETHLQFLNTAQDGPGVDLPPGLLRMYQRRADGSVDMLGEDLLLAVPSEGQGHVLVGTARGLRGERERTGYAEITPLRVYEESFQIRVENDTDETVEIRVVEHLYRWHDYEIVRADAEYETIAPQTIEFRPSLRPGGKRTIHYTVRYSW